MAQQILNVAIADRYVQIADAVVDWIGRTHPVEVSYAHGAGELRDTLRDRKIDILLLNAEMAVDTGVNLVTAIRRMEHGFESNPFLVVATVVHDRNKTHVPAVLDAGVDCGLLIPTPVETMAEALVGTIENRRKWVIVPPYIGPDRRPPKGKEDPDLIMVPNTALRKMRADRAGLAKDLAAIGPLAGTVEDVAIAAIVGRLGRMADQINGLSVKDMVMMLPSIRTQLAHDLGVMASIPRYRTDRVKGPMLRRLQEGVLRAIPTSGADPSTLSRLQAATNEMAEGLRGLPS